MKKVIFTLALVSMFGLAACGEGAATNDSNNDSNAKDTTNVENNAPAPVDSVIAPVDSVNAQ